MLEQHSPTNVLLKWQERRWGGRGIIPGASISRCSKQNLQLASVEMTFWVLEPFYVNIYMF